MRTRLLFAAIVMLAATTTTVRAASVSIFATDVYQNLYGITADAAAVYVSGATGVIRNFNNDPANGVIGRIPFHGSGLVTLYSKSNYATVSGHVAPFQLAADRTGHLFWADPDAGPGTGAAFLSGTTSGAAPTQFFGICCGPSVLPGDGIGLALSGGHVSFSDGTGGRIGVDPSGSSARQIGPTRYAPDFATEAWSQIAIANGSIFIADSAEQRGFDSSTGTAVIQDQSASITPAVRVIAINGSGGFRTLSSGIIPHPQGIAAAGHLLYVTSGNAIWTVDQVTGRTRKLMSNRGFKDLQGITLHKGALYVADSQNTFGPFVNGLAHATRDQPGIVWKVIP